MSRRSKHRQRAQSEQLETRRLLASWTPLVAPAPAGVGTMMLLSDGTVMAQKAGTTKEWYKLTPDPTGGYVAGTWSNLASMSLERLFYASNVLPDGRVFLLGGEYVGPNADPNRVNSGEIYNPVTNTWTAIANHPESQYGDTPSALLPDGRVLCGSLTSANCYIYNPATNAWTAAGTKMNGDRSNEEAWVKLPDDSILSYNIFGNPQSAQRYNPSSNQWVASGTVPVQLHTNPGSEIGAAFRAPDGRILYIGGTNHNAFYTPSTTLTGTGSWVAGQDTPGNIGANDAPGCMLPNGNVLYCAGDTSTSFAPPTSVFLYNTTANTISPVSMTNGPQLAFVKPFTTRMLMLPNGQVLFSLYSNQLYLYTPDGPVAPANIPAIANIKTTGSNAFTLSGYQLNGTSEGASYGDDAQMSTNYPIVKTTTSAGVVSYARTFNWSSTGVATGSNLVTTQYTIPSASFTGARLLSVIANGVSSATVLDVQGTPAVDTITLSTSGGNTIVNLNGVNQSFATSSFSGIIINGGASGDTINLNGLASPPNVTVNGGAGDDQLFLNNAGNTPRTYRISGHDIIPSGGGSIVTYDPDCELVVLNTGTGNDTVDVVNSYPTTGIIVDSAGGSDIVNVGLASTDFTGNAQGITGGILIRTAATLNIADNSDATARTAYIDAFDADTHYNRVSSLSPGTIDFRPATIGIVNITTGQGSDDITVRGVDVFTNIQNGGSLRDSYHVGITSSLANVHGIVQFLRGPGGGDHDLDINDSTNTGARTYNIGFGQLNTSFASSIHWDVTSTHVADLWTGAGADTVNVTANGNSLVLNSSFVRDTFNVANHAGGGLVGVTAPIQINVNSSGGTVILDDTGNNAARNVSMVASGGYEVVSGLAPAPISYSGTGLDVPFATGGGNDTIQVVSQNDPNGALRFFSAGGDDDLTLGDVFNRATSLGGTIIINNDAGRTALHVRDTVDTVGRNILFDVSGTLNQLTGISPAIIQWDPNDVSPVEVDAGTKADTITVNRMLLGRGPAVYLNGNGDNDTFIVNDMANFETAQLASHVYLSGGDGADQIIVNDAADTVTGAGGSAYGVGDVISHYTIDGGGGYHLFRVINHDTTETLQLTGSANPDVVFANPSSATVTKVIVDGGGQNDNIEVEQNPAGGVTVVHAVSGNDSVLVEANASPGRAVFDQSTHLASLSITNGGGATVVANGNLTVDTNTLSITGSGRLDLNDNDLIVRTTPKTTIEGYIRTAYNFGGWDGPSGIFSSAARDNPGGNTTLGLLSGQEFNDNNGGTFNGVSINNTDVLVKYTYYGDVDFNGSVDVSDYNLIDFGFANHLTGWANGDADWSGGPTDVSDYNLIDFAFASQGGAL